jgi:hypothetical protein
LECAVRDRPLRIVTANDSGRHGIMSVRFRDGIFQCRQIR